MSNTARELTDKLVSMAAHVSHYNDAGALSLTDESQSQCKQETARAIVEANSRASN